MNSCSEQLFLVLTNSCATTQLSTATTSEIMLPDIHFPFTHTHTQTHFQFCYLLLAEGILAMVFITVFGISILFYLLINRFNCKIC